jgi:hypothetical protein
LGFKGFWSGWWDSNHYGIQTARNLLIARIGIPATIAGNAPIYKILQNYAAEHVWYRVAALCAVYLPHAQRGSVDFGLPGPAPYVFLWRDMARASRVVSLRPGIVILSPYPEIGAVRPRGDFEPSISEGWQFNPGMILRTDLQTNPSYKIALLFSII